MVYARKTQKGSGSCFSKGQNRVSPLPILYDTNIVEFSHETRYPFSKGSRFYFFNNNRICYIT